MGNRYKKPSGKSFSTRQSATAINAIIRPALKRTAARPPRRKKDNIKTGVARNLGAARLTDSRHELLRLCKHKPVHVRKIGPDYPKDSQGLTERYWTRLGGRRYSRVKISACHVALP